MRRLWRSVLDGLIPYDAGLSLEALAHDLGRSDLVRLSANENPLGPSPLAIAAVEREAPRIHLYPDGGSTALREALGRSHGVAPNQIVVGNGADELIALIATAAFESGDEVVGPMPSFEPYEISARLVLHMSLALSLAPLLMVKVIVARYQKARRDLLTALESVGSPSPPARQ